MISEKTRYDNVAIALHWLMAAMILFLLGSVFLGDLFPKSVRGFFWYMHKPLGISILALAVFRLVWRLLNPPPAPMAGQSKLQEVVAQLVHWMLYLAMILVPLCGWAMISVIAKRQVDFFGLFTVPFLPLPAFEDPKAMRKLFHEGHELFANGILVLVGLHVLAAIKHQWINRDGLMLRMMPKRSALPRRTKR